MQVTLLSHSDISLASTAIRTCYQSRGDNGGPKDMELINRVANVYKHASTIEHLHYCFYIKGISRACLQELARHRMASLSVKSTRYTLKELRGQEPFGPDETKRAEQFLVLTKDELIDAASIAALERVRALMNEPKASMDLVKYCLPECYKTELTWSINARSLQNFLTLRSSAKALWEIRKLARAVYEALPKEHEFIFASCIEEG